MQRMLRAAHPFFFEKGDSFRWCNVVYLVNILEAKYLKLFIIMSEYEGIECGLHPTVIVRCP